MRERLLIVIGTRPEVIKLAPVVQALKSHPDRFEIRVVLTAQHRELVDQMLEFFELTPDIDLNLMEPDQDLSLLAGRVMAGLDPVLAEWQPQRVLVQGDTTTAMAAALAASYRGIPVAHVEAGLRTHSLSNPFPEEMNRQIISRLASLHFAPTDAARKNLLAEGVETERIFVTGNTVVDSVKWALNRLDRWKSPEIEGLSNAIPGDGFLLVTCHRRENFGEGIRQLIGALKQLASEGHSVVYPVHPNPAVKEPVFESLGKISNIILTQPVSYPAFLWLMKRCRFILTDSGGIQEEAPTIGKRVLLMRTLTERAEAVETGWVRMVPVEKRALADACRSLAAEVAGMSPAANENPFGDGHASERIVTILADQ